MSGPGTVAVVSLASLLVATTAGAQVWTESRDATSFPDRPAQVTRGEGVLTRIDGATGFGDRRDAFCIKIVDPAGFVATTDPAINPDAAASFDTRLLLFRPDGRPVLANDDTPPGGAPFLSTLTAAATDGSGFVLNRFGDYVLVLSDSQDPRDAADVELFLLAPPGVVAAANAAAGAFDHWGPAPLLSGDYSIALTGAEFCQDELDAVVANNGANRSCAGDNSGGFWACADADLEQEFTRSVALGFIDNDRHMDVVFGNYDTADRVCLGGGSGRFTRCADVDANLDITRGVALGLVDLDETVDAIFAKSGANRVCFGDGAGSFGLCVEVTNSGEFTRAVALGYVNGDRHLDAVFANNGEANRVCLGDGVGGFGCASISDDVFNSGGVALADVDNDGRLDAVFANSGPNRICYGDGEGGFTACSGASADLNETWGIALGYIDGDQDVDLIFANYASANQVCLGDGAGGFSCSDVSDGLHDSRNVALGLFDEDDLLDVVFANPGGNRLCLGDGFGGFSCADAGNDVGDSYAVAVGEVGSPLIFADGFESGDTSAWSTTVP